MPFLTKNNRIFRLILLSLLCSMNMVSLSCCSTSAISNNQLFFPGTNQKLLHASDFIYEGAFRVPSGTFGCSDGTACAFDYGGRGLAYNSTNNTLLIVGHRYNGWVAEINIPTFVNSSNINSLNTATVRQNFTDLLGGKLGYLGASGSFVSNGGEVGGILINGTKVVISQWAYYDAGNDAVLSHATSNINWVANGVGFSGMKTVGAGKVGFTAGYMTTIPSTWQAVLGGTALTGQACIPIISRTSLGPSAFVFDPSQINVTDPVPATALLNYPDGHLTLGSYSASNTYIGGSDIISGIVWPERSRSVLFFGRHGSTYCYGQGTLEPALHGKPTGQGDKYCYDPGNLDKGPHGYPYNYRVWAYDANDLLAVKKGTINPWEVTPYSAWDFTLPFQNESKIILSAAYDPATQRIYLSQDHGEGSLPVIHVFKLTI